MRQDSRESSGFFQKLWTFTAKPGLAGADDGLGPVDHLELAEDVGDVVLHRLEAEE